MNACDMICDTFNLLLKLCHITSNKSEVVQDVACPACFNSTGGTMSPAHKH